jgi:hypothetical protein
MKLACASSAFHQAIERGDLTQLEFLDLCAHELACDGIVLDVRHFPRTDDDYLAQVKKMATDRGLGIAALADSFFDATDDGMNRLLGYAVALGAPLVAGTLARETDRSWSEQLERLNAATAFAKAANVTLTVRNAPETFAAGTHDCKRVAKEADSAWLRFGPEPAAFGAGSEPAELAANSVLVWSDVRDPDAARGEWVAGYSALRGYLALDDSSGGTSIVRMRDAVRAWRSALNEIELNRT